MPFNVNIIWLPVLVPFIMAGYDFLQHEDFGMAFTTMVSKKTILLTIGVLFLCVIIQMAVF